MAHPPHHQGFLASDVLTPGWFPIGTRALQAHFASNFDSPTGLGASFAPLLFPRVLRSMEPTDLAYFDKLWSTMFGVPTLTALSDTADKRNAAWKNIDAALSALSQIYDHADGAVFLGGECPLYADFLVAATLVTVRLVFEREEWEMVSQRNAGRWGRLMAAIEGWITVH